MTYQELAKQSLEVQDACNLSGVVKAFARGMDVLWAEAHRTNQGTDFVNQHPIVTVFLSKLSSLNGNQSYFTASDRVEEIANQPEVVK